MTDSQKRPPAAPEQDRPDGLERETSEERLALKAMLALFALAGLVIAALTIFGGGPGGD